MHSRSSKPAKKNLIIDVDSGEAPDPVSPRARELREQERIARMERALETHQQENQTSFRERHALKVMGTIMAAMFALVLVAQVGC